MLVLRFFEAYRDHGINFWAVTPQNEPTTGADLNYTWQTMFFDAQTERYLSYIFALTLAGKIINIPVTL